MSATVSQAPVELGLKWYEGDAVNLAFTVLAVDWTGTYDADLILKSGTVVQMTMTATLSSGNTAFSVTLNAAGSATVPAGRHLWRAKVGDLTRFAGVVEVVNR